MAPLLLGRLSGRGRDGHGRLGSWTRRPVSGGPIRAVGLTVNGLTDPVGIDPDGCSFAWTLHSPGVPWPRPPSVSWCGAPTRPGPGWSGTVARWLRPGRRSWPTAGRTRRRRRVPVDGPGTGPGGGWGPVAAPAQFTTALRDGDWQAQWLRPAGASRPDRVTYLRTDVTPPAGAVARATAFVSAAHTYRLFVDGTPVDAWPSFSYPDEQYVRTVDLTGDGDGWATSAVGVLHRWYGPGQGRPGLGARPALPALRLVPRRPPRRVRIGRHLA